MKRTAIFHFSNKPAFPSLDGGCIAIKDLLSNLMSIPDFDVTHFTLSTFKHPFHRRNYPKLWREKLRIDAADINTHTNIVGALYHLLSNTSYNVARFYDDHAAKELKALLDHQHYDIVVMESIYLLPYLPIFKAKGIKIIVRTHNVEHLIWKGLAKQEKHLLKSIYLRILSAQLKKYELHHLRKVDGIIAISKEDAHFFAANRINCAALVLPTSMEIIPSPCTSDASDFYYLGAMDWFPNLEGMNWLYNEVIKMNVIPAPLHLAGKNLKASDFVHPNIINHGEVKSAKDFIANHGICLIPLFSGGGIKIKLLENMAAGKAIITTPEGIRGIPVKHDQEVIIADTPEAFYEAMLELHANQSKRKALGKAAQQFVSKHYNKNEIIQTLEQFIRNI